MLGKKSTSESVENSALFSDVAAYKAANYQRNLMISQGFGVIFATGLAIHVRHVGKLMLNLPTGKTASKERRIMESLLPMKLAQDPSTKSRFINS